MAKTHKPISTIVKLNSSTPYCIICNSEKLTLHNYPPNRFNGKEFNYYRCRECNSISVHPIPSQSDMNRMYGTTDHSYLEVLKEGEELAHKYDYPKYHHQGYQIQYFENEMGLAIGNKMLDFACGSGFYMQYFKQKGFDPVGVEFNSNFADLLKEKTGLNICSIDEFEQKNINAKFDVIHYGHVLEHMPNPAEALEWSKKYAHSKTLFVIDGPLEFNTCLSRTLAELSADYRCRKYLTHQPQHLMFANAKSQLRFFQQAGLFPINYHVAEQSYPFPNKPNWKSPSVTIQYLISQLSIRLSKLSSSHGNIFHFIGVQHKC